MIRYRPGIFVFSFRRCGIAFMLPFATRREALDWAAGHRIKGSVGEVDKRRGKSAGCTGAGG